MNRSNTVKDILESELQDWTDSLEHEMEMRHGYYDLMPNGRKIMYKGIMEHIQVIRDIKKCLSSLIDSDFDKTIKLLGAMTSIERLNVFSEYCTHCGDKDPSCKCWNDE